MNAQELSNLEEAYVKVYEDQQLDELSVGKMLAYMKAAKKDRDVLTKKWDAKKEKVRVLGREGKQRAARNIKKKTGKYPNQMNALDRLRYAITREEVDIYNLSEAYLDVYSQVAELDEANKGDEYAASKVHPIFARSIKQQRRNASFDSGATHSKAPRMTSGQQSEIENMPNGGPAEVSRQKTLMRQRYTRNMRGVKPKR